MSATLAGTSSIHAARRPPGGIQFAGFRVPVRGGTDTTHYQPGICNIGPAEIARRRRAGHIGALATILVLAAVVAVGAPPQSRLVLVLPAAGSASGYLQAWLRFCVAFGSRGIFNFGALGRAETVADTAARARDRARAFLIGLASLGIGLVVGIAAVLLPL